jgi:hypothetical protein
VPPLDCFVATRLAMTGNWTSKPSPLRGRVGWGCTTLVFSAGAKPPPQALPAGEGLCGAAYFRAFFAFLPASSAISAGEG